MFSKPLIMVLFAGLGVVLLVGCTTKTDPRLSPSPTKGGTEQITLHVDGMTKIQGITWLTWPNGVKEALSGLPGIEKLAVDLKEDSFRIVYDPALVTPERMLETVREQGFQGKVVESDAPIAPISGTVRRDLARLPQALFIGVQKAKREGKPVLFAFHGPGWLPCKRMDTVTYPDAEVKKELTDWVLLKVDIEEHREVAELFEVAGIPVAVAVTVEGDELGRIEDFIEPAAFRSQLERISRWRRWLHLEKMACMVDKAKWGVPCRDNLSNLQEE